MSVVSPSLQVLQSLKQNSLTFIPLMKHHVFQWNELSTFITCMNVALKHHNLRGVISLLTHVPYPIKVQIMFAKTAIAIEFSDAFTFLLMVLKTQYYYVTAEQQAEILVLLHTVAHYESANELSRIMLPHTEEHSLPAPPQTDASVLMHPPTSGASASKTLPGASEDSGSRHSKKRRPDLVKKVNTTYRITHAPQIKLVKEFLDTRYVSVPTLRPQDMISVGSLLDDFAFWAKNRRHNFEDFNTAQKMGRLLQNVEWWAQQRTKSRSQYHIVRKDDVTKDMVDDVVYPPNVSVHDALEHARAPQKRAREEEEEEEEEDCNESMIDHEAQEGSESDDDLMEAALDAMYGSVTGTPADAKDDDVSIDLDDYLDSADI